MDHQEMVDLRREFHVHPEPAWCEFWTTARIVSELERIGVDEVYVGRDAVAADARRAVPDEATLAAWRDRARDAGADPAVLDATSGGVTGAVAVHRAGEGPSVALRVDVDGLVREEATGASHVPATEGFRSETPAMHACGHDAHVTVGLAVLEAVQSSDFAGTFTLCFQPAEERIGGGDALAQSGHLDDVDDLFALHVGLGHPTGEVVAGVDEFLAVRQFRATFTGEPAHAGARPEEGRSAAQAAATAVSNVHGAPRHSGGATRVNVGVLTGGTAPNIVPERVAIEGEVRGETTALREHCWTHVERTLRSAAAMHGCSVDVERLGEAPSAVSDPSLAGHVARAARALDGVEAVRDTGALGGSEDATVLMRHVQERGGRACYCIVGTDHPGGHHTATFDVDERTLPQAVETLTEAVRSAARD
ncbi:MAG: amidohydrolase [Halobacteriaceae archaeon]